MSWKPFSFEIILYEPQQKIEIPPALLKNLLCLTCHCFILLRPSAPLPSTFVETAAKRTSKCPFCPYLPALFFFLLFSVSCISSPWPFLVFLREESPARMAMVSPTAPRFSSLIHQLTVALMTLLSLGPSAPHSPPILFIAKRLMPEPHRSGLLP